MNIPQNIPPLNRKSFARLVGGNDDLFQYVQERADGHVIIGYDASTAEFLQYPEHQARFGDPSAPPCLKILFGETHAFSIPLIHLTADRLYDNWVYRITFAPASDEAKEILAHPSFVPFRSTRGYIGMTSRPNPFDRFREHQQKARNGNGHLLHNAWAAISQQTDVKVQFHLAANVKTREQAFEVEETLVDQWGTVAPGGLNVIPGGMKGIRELWKLGVLAERDKPTERNVDRALELIESDRSPVASHYRKGHIRKLPERYAMRTTWVSPCWVGLNGASQ